MRLFLIVFMASLTLACSILPKDIATKSQAPKKELLITAKPSEDPADLEKIFGSIEIFPKNQLELPYRAVRFRVQLLKTPHNEVVSEKLSDSNGLFEFKVEPETQYFLRIYTNQNKPLEALHGPFQAKDAISIKIQN